MNSADEAEVLKYLNCYPKQFVSGKEVCRRAGGRRRYERDPRWAMPILEKLEDRGLVEVDSDHRYRVLVTESERETTGPTTSAQTDGGPQKIFEITEEEIREPGEAERDPSKSD